MGTCCDVAASRGVLHTGRLGVAVVFHNKYCGEFPDGCQVQAFVEGAFVSTAITEETDGNRSAALYLCRKCCPTSQRDAATDNAVSTEHPPVYIGDVHGATLTFTGTGGASIQFSHHLVDTDTLGDTVTVTAVGTSNTVRIGQMGADTDRHCFLPCVKVDKARNSPGGVFVVYAVLELADGDHPLVNLKQFISRNIHTILLPISSGFKAT